MQAFLLFFFVCPRQKGDQSPRRSGDRGNRGQISRRDESHARKNNAKDAELFRNRLVREFYRLQNSPYFCVFKYARAVKQKVFTDFVEKKNRLFCSLRILLFESVDYFGTSEYFSG